MAERIPAAMRIKDKSSYKEAMEVLRQEYTCSYVQRTLALQ